MGKRSGLVALIGVLGTTSLVWAAAQAPADATFRDASVSDTSGTVFSTDMIRSDGRGAYQDGIDCAISRVSNSQFFLRTVSYGCFTPIPRTITLDFSQPVTPPASCTATDAYVGGTLDTCGPNVVADVRLVANSMFAGAALTKGTPVTLLFSLAPNFSGPGSFELAFEQNVAVTAGSHAGVRQITAPETSIAELYQNVPTSRKSSVKVSLGRYYIPFALTVETLP